VEMIITTGERHGAAVCGEDWVKDPAVHVATLRNDAAALRRLLDRHANPNSVARGGYTPLHIAAHFGREEALEARPAAVDPASRARASWRPRPTQALLSAGADPTLLNDWRYSPLHFAAMRAEPRCCAALLAHPLHESILDARDKEWNTPLTLAVYYGREPQVRSF